MNVCSPREVAQLLNDYGIHPSKALGQNFLIDRNILPLIVEAAGVREGTRVLEIGPGLGALTETILAAGATLTFVEKDLTLEPILRARFENHPACTLIFEDALKLDLGSFFKGGITHLVANLPYSVGTRIVVDAALSEAPPERMTLLLQKEVCKRFAAKESEPDRGAISVWLQRLYDIKLVRDVSPGCFVPRPEVMSTIVSLKRHNRHPLSAEDAAYFVNLTKAAFLHRRKQLASSMRSAGVFSKSADQIRTLLAELSLPPTVRAEELTLEQWLELSQLWKNS